MKEKTTFSVHFVISEFLVTSEHIRVTRVLMSTFIVWLNPQRGKMKRILLSDWLPEQGPSSPLRNCRIGLAIKSSLFWPYNKFLIPKLVRSRWLDISFILFCVFIDLDFVSVHKNAAKKKHGQYLAISWPHAWSITHILFYYTVYYLW